MPVITRPVSSNGNGNDKAEDRVPRMIVPFIRASSEHLQPGNVDRSVTMSGNATDLGVQDVPAYGYLRHLYVLVEATGGAAGLATVAADEDAPFNVLQNIALTEPNGAYIVQFNDGWQMYLSHKYGGMVAPYAADPRNSPAFADVDTDGNFSFLVRLPVAVSVRDGVGALANQDSAGQFKFRATVAGTSTVYGTPPDTPPAVRVRAWLSAYDQPEPTTANMHNQVEPPAVGTTSYWSIQSGVSIVAGENTIELKRKGNFLRQILFVYRDSSGSRATAETNFPAETRFVRDAFAAKYYNDSVWRHEMFEKTGYAAANESAGGLDDGVRFHDYAHEFDGGLGRENRDLWQPTLSSTRLELAGNFGTDGKLDIITNDVAVAANVFL